MSAASDVRAANLLSMSQSYQQTGPASAPQARKVVFTAPSQKKGFWDNVASFTTSFGSNADLLYTSKATGVAANSITIRYVVAGNSTALSVSVSGSAITVNLATDSGGAPTSTASQVLAAVQASAPATALVASALAPGSSGAGVPAALSATPLAGGTDSTRGPISNAGFPHQHPIHNSYT